MQKCSHLLLEEQLQIAVECSFIWSFQISIQFDNKSQVWKITQSVCIQCLDSNSWPLEHGSPSITTRPWLTPSCDIFVLTTFVTSDEIDLWHFWSSIFNVNSAHICCNETDTKESHSIKLFSLHKLKQRPASVMKHFCPKYFCLFWTLLEPGADVRNLGTIYL